MENFSKFLLVLLQKDKSTNWYDTIITRCGSRLKVWLNSNVLSARRGEWLTARGVQQFFLTCQPHAQLLSLHWTRTLARIPVKYFVWHCVAYKGSELQIQLKLLLRFAFGKVRCRNFKRPLQRHDTIPRSAPKHVVEVRRYGSSFTLHSDVYVLIWM